MLSSKLKSWMESHLTRKKSSSGSSGTSTSNKKCTSAFHGSGSNSTGSYKELSPADRIAHPASGLVNLVPAVPLCSTSGRSNAGLVIRLQNDFRENQHASPCHLRHQHPSWTRSPVMLAWNTKIHPPPVPQRPIEPPLSPPSSHCSTIIQQNGEPSPTGSDWTSKSFADESGIGRTDRDGSLSSSKANTTGSSIGTGDFHHESAGRRINAPSLSSPESAYSTGCSADGVSPSQDGTYDSNFHPHQPLAALLLDPIWRRSTLEADASGSNSSTQSPRTRPAIRTNPWLPVRTSLTSAGSTTSDRASWMTDSTPEAPLSEICPPAVKETDIVSSGEDPADDPIAAAMAACAANDELDQLCDSLQLLMDGDNLRVVSTTGQPAHRQVATVAPHQTAKTGYSPAVDRRRATEVDVDDQYTLLIRQTEEILLQLEKDEMLLCSRKNMNQDETDAAALHLLPAGKNNISRQPCSLSSGSHLKQPRRRLRKRPTSRRRCSSRNSAILCSSPSSSSESSDCEYLDNNSRRTSSDWNANRRPKNMNSLSKGITPRFAQRQSVRVLPQTPSLLPAQPPRDCWILGSQKPSCSPDDWTTEHDRPPSPAPMDPHCHWASHPVRHCERMAVAATRSPSVSSCSSNSRRNSRVRAKNCAGHLSSSGPTSPVMRLDAWPDDDYHPQTNNGGAGRRWRQSMTREQQRLESQIAFLRRQLKDVTDDYYDYDRGARTPSSTSDSSSHSHRLK
ncbi:uncharacterized protein LOC130694280 [Daphnia carinata]|uniref:uncharacterized protein LOC130694280 n=1 Tax=Daphnia carinata TaxID=120202 RepID=UPI00257FF7C3|nr:uncharacterized protein LOC130694280 [Daphnia carinata]